MIEVEKKFLLNKEQEKKLITEAEFIGEKVFTDVYYDNADFALTTNDKWLRSRSGKFELKLPLNPDLDHRMGDLYDEVEDEEKIKELFKIFKEKDLKQGLRENGYSEFCVCKTTRRKYKKQGFGIDIDLCEYEDKSTYELAEIELMIEDKSEMASAMEKILGFAKDKGLKIGYVRGKVLVYLREKSPKHFQALVASGVVKPEQA